MTPPTDIPAERAVLGSAMLDPQAMVRAADTLAPDDFYREAHGTTWRVMLDMMANGDLVEMAAVCGVIVAGGLTDACGGIAYISALPDNVPSTENVEHYANRVKGMATRRALMTASQEVIALAADGGCDLQEVLDGSSRAIAEVVHAGQNDGGMVGMIDLVGASMDALHEAEETRRAGGQVGLSLPWVTLARKLAIKRTDLVVVAGRPAMGKTAFGLQLLSHAARQGEAGIIFELEMSAAQCATRILCQEARVTGSEVTRGRLTGDDWERLDTAAPSISTLPLKIDDTPAVTIHAIRARVAREKARTPSLSWVLVDYIGLMSGDSRQPRHLQISEVSRGLKLCAKESSVAVIAVAQLNREVEKRPKKIPIMADLRDSGSIEQDADAIVLLYREDYYRPDETMRPNVADIIIAKQRGGETGTVELAWDGPSTRFDDLDRIHDESGGWSRVQ